MSLSAELLLRQFLGLGSPGGRALARRYAPPGDVAERIVTLRRDGLTLKEIADKLTHEGVPTAKGGRWWPATVGQVEARWLRDREYARDRMSDPGQPITVRSDEEAAQVRAANDERLALCDPVPAAPVRAA